MQLYSLAETPQLPLLPPHLGSYTMALLVSQDRRHLFVTPWCARTELKTFLVQQVIFDLGVTDAVDGGNGLGSSVNVGVVP